MTALRHGRASIQLSIALFPTQASRLLLLFCGLQERKDGLMEDMSAPTRKRLAELGTVRLRSSSKAVADLERGADELSSSDVPPLRARYGSGASQQVSREADGEGLDTVGSMGSPPSALEVSHDGRPSNMQEWDALGARPSSMVRFATHARSASGTQYPLQR